jgi:plastocyanin
MIVVAGIFLMLAFDKYPTNQLVTKKQFLLSMAIIVFLYHGFQLYKKNKEGLEVCPPPTKVEVISESKNSLTDVDLTGMRVHHIRIFDSDPGYSHPSLKIKQGDVVVWTNVGELEHSVTSANRAQWLDRAKMEISCEFNSGHMKPGQTFAIKFNQKGWFPYFCMGNKGWMQGEIHVE